jgi:glycosyltransferase involved in cell wall biosynthesis
MSSPLVSVIIPTYNRAGIICRTLDNLFEQTYPNFEMIVVDDGSTDDTLSALHRYGDKIQVISQKNAGPAAARNRGVNTSRGEIIAFQDSDDLWKPTKLERQVRLLEKDKSIPCCLCNIVLRTLNGKEITSFGDSLIFPRNEEGIWLNASEVLATRFVLFNQAVAIRREAWEKAGGFDEKLKYFEDYDLPLRLSLAGPWAFVREPLVIYSADSPASFSKMAAQDKITVLQCGLKICERVMLESKGAIQQEALCRYLKLRMGVFQREMNAIEVRNKKFLGAGMAADFLMYIERLRNAGFRRSPWFPQVLDRPI